MIKMPEQVPNDWDTNAQLTALTTAVNQLIDVVYEQQLEIEKLRKSKNA